MGVCKVIVIGHLGSDPEIRMAGDAKVASFGVAVTEKYKKKDGEQVEKTEWINVVYFGRVAEICESYLKKGSQVYVEGKLETQSWDDATSGEKKYKTIVKGLNMQMLGGGSNTNDSSNEPAAPEDDCPF